MVAREKFHDDRAHAGALVPSHQQQQPPLPLVPLTLGSRPGGQWMSGSGVHIFSIMITFYAVYNPIKSATTVNTGARRVPYIPGGCH